MAARRRLAHATGLELPATLAFDYPTPHEVRELVLASIRTESPHARSPHSTDALDELDTDEFIHTIGALLQEQSA